MNCCVTEELTGVDGVSRVVVSEPCGEHSIKGELL